MSPHVSAIFAHRQRRQRVAMASTTAALFAFAASASQLNDIIKNTQDTLQTVLKLLMTLAVVVFIWGIVKLMAAAGNPQKMREAKSTLLLGIVSLAVLASLAGLIAFFQTYFGISAGNPIKVPQF